MSAADILRRAAQLIEDRAKQRDKPNGEKSMADTVAAFNAIYHTEMTEVQGWHFMELLKMVRSAAGVYVQDDYDDKVAYAALAAEAVQCNVTISAETLDDNRPMAPCARCSNGSSTIGGAVVCPHGYDCGPSSGWRNFTEKTT